MIFKKNKQQFLLDDGIKAINNEISKKLEKKKGSIVVLVAGGTASGKTSAVASKIAGAFKDSQILSMDNYYRGPTFMSENPKLNVDQPEALNLDLFFKHLKALKKGENVKIPLFDFKNDPKLEHTLVKSSKIIIVEGLFALTDKLSKLGDIKVFVDLGSHSQILRRLFRDVERTGNSPNDILKYFLGVVSPMHKKYIEPTKQNANFVLINEYIPDLESQNAKSKDFKLKYKLNGDHNKHKISEVVHKLGGTYVGKLEQTDYYFDPNGSYKKTGEVLKIRKLGFGRYFFTYYGPKVSGKSYLDRFTLRFFIDYTTLLAFKELFPINQYEIIKLRRNFFISGVLVCLDELENGDKYLVFKFEEKNKRTIILEILEHLGIDARRGCKKSYLELTN